jgi:hypothetical protein
MTAQMELPSPFCRNIEALARGIRFGAEGEDVEEQVKKGLMGCVQKGLGDVLKSIRDHLKGWEGNKKVNWGQVGTKVLHTVREKLNVVATAKEMWQLAMKKGWRMAAIAIVWEIFEQIVLPGISIAIGYPELVPFFMAMHLEPIIFPIAFCLL